MSVWKLILAGIAGTLIMNAFVYLVACFVDKRLKVMRVLGTMLTNQTTPNKGLSRTSSARITGFIAHYTVGIIFSFLYGWLLAESIIRPGIKYSFLFGILIGLFAVCIWKVFFKVHPFPPYIELSSYLPTIFTGHLFFALGLYLVLQI